MEAITPVSTMRTPSGGSNPASPSRRKPPLVLRLLSLLCFVAGFVIVAAPLVLRAMSQAEQTAAVTAAAAAAETAHAPAEGRSRPLFS